jgi:hemoglobin/transferrin/lactoferrin receptor protein
VSAPGETQTASAAKVEKVTVTATRQRRNVDEVPATVTVITAKEIEDNLATDVKDLVRFEPGVSVRTNPARFTAAGSSTGRDGNSGFNIRGLEGNRVLIQIDGIRVPDGFTFGPQAVGRGDYLDLDILKSVEILRGPASALYGSDGVAGAVSFITKDPEDIIAEGETFAARARVSYSSADDSFAEGVMAATQTQDGQWQGLLAYTRRDAHETETQGENDSANTSRTTANPQDIESNSVFGKILFVPNESNRFRLTGEYFDRTIDTEVLSARAVVPSSAAANVIDLDAIDETTRNRVAFDHRYEGEGFISSAFWSVYYQTAETREFSDEDRFTSADRTRDSKFDNSVWGAAGQLESEFDLGGIANSLVYGFEYSVTHQEGLRDGITPPAGETFPTQPFPNTDFTLAGFFIQDEISLADGKLKLYPAVRYDSFEIEPEASPLYPGAISPQKDSAISPKFGAVFWPVNEFGLFANYAQGFKAPAPSQVNNGFQNAAANYISIPNPDLRPETSESYEGGVRFRDIEFAGANISTSATAFIAYYEDFIEQVTVSGTFLPPPAAPTVFQFINLGEVEVSGYEAKLDARWDSGFSLTVAASTARGDQVNLGVKSPLPSIEPFKFVGGVRYDDPEGMFGGQAIMTYSGQKDSDRIPATLCAPSCFTPDGFTILDLTAYWNITDDATLRVGVFNVFDEKYTWWGDVRGVASTSAVVDAYTQPGRNASASFVYRF